MENKECIPVLAPACLTKSLVDDKINERLKDEEFKIIEAIQNAANLEKYECTLGYLISDKLKEKLVSLGYRISSDSLGGEAQTTISWK